MEELPTSAPRRALAAAVLGAKSALKTAWFLLKIMVPVTLAVALLGWSGILAKIASLLAPAMGLLGLPGDAALVFISSALLNIYSAIAVAGSLSLDLREATILAVMCLTAHNLLVETAVMKKTGSSATKMVLLRLGSAILAGWIYSLILPRGLSASVFSAGGPAARPEFWPMLAAWALSTARLVAKIGLLVLAIMVVQRILEEFRFMDFLSRLFAPFMKFLGLPERASFLWIVINIVGYAYGAGIVGAEIQSGRMKPQEGDLFNHHASLCHSLLEDTALFAAVGVPIFWTTLPRLAAATAAVWIERGRRHFFRRSFRAGIG
ncbi:MAG: transporter [Spirochaetaceae bacterium]|nr:transporter [Spirochaetaceae bacterium]